MKQEPFVIERTYPVPVHKVWQAITDVAQMKQWYFKMDAFEPVEGFEFSFIGKDNNNVEFVHLCTIVEVIEHKKLKHSWAYKGYEGKSFVTWELFAEGNATRVKLTHEGLETFPPLQSFAKENFAQGWNFIVGKSLPEFLEK